MMREWILYGTVIGACCAAFAWAVDTWLRASGRPRRWVWIAAMVAAVVVPAIVAVRPRVTMDAAPAWNPAVNEVRRLAAVEVTVPQRSIAGPLWAGGSAWLVLCIVGGLIQLRRERRRASHETWEATRVAVTDRVGPGAGPFGEPRIFVPGWVRSLPGEQVALLLHHEREHVAAGDARLLLGGAALLCVAPWNLALWWCFSRLRTAIECDCDARVLRGNATAGVGEYARLLLDLARPVPRVTPLPALLPLAGSIHQLRTRIESMTASYRLSPSRVAASVVVASLALVAGCETRRPDPVAPVTDYIVREGQAAPVRITERNGDSLRQSLVTKVEGSLAQLNEGGDPSQPVVVVKDAAGGVVYSRRLEGGASAALSQIMPSRIASIEVIKNANVLPEGAKGGLIMIQLKAGAAWPGASADSAAGIRYKAPELSKSPARAPVRVPGTVLPSPLPSSEAGDSAAPARVPLRTAPTDVPPLTGDNTPAARQAAPPIIELLDATGRELWSGRLALRTLDRDDVVVAGPWHVRSADIERIEVQKRVVPEGLITVRLKAGAQPVAR